MLKKAREIAAITLRTAADLLPAKDWLPIKITRWFWMTTAALIAPKEDEEPIAPRDEPKEEEPPSRGALPEIDAVALKNMLKDTTTPLLVDVREPQETAHGVIPGALLIPMGSVSSRIDEIKEARRPVVVYCAHGQRSARIVAYLRDQGLYAVSLQGGITGWTGQGGAIEQPASA